MEIFNASVVVVVFVVVFFKLAIKTSSHWRGHKFRLPPGPWQLPVIGSIHHMAGSPPHRRLRDLARAHGPIMHLKLGEVPTVVVSTAEVVREVVKGNDLAFSSRPLISAADIISYGGRSLIFAPYGDFWRHLRKICVLELLSAKRVNAFRSIREEEVLGLVRSIYATPSPASVNMTQKMNSLANDVTMRASIGDKCKDQDTFMEALLESVDLAGGFDLADIFPSSKLLAAVSTTRFRLRRCHRKLDRILDGIIAEHKERRAAAVAAGDGQPEDQDLLDVLLRVQEEPNSQFTLTPVHLKAVITDMVTAGSETSATTMGWVMTELVRNPGVMKRAQSEIRGVLGRNGSNSKIREEDLEELKYLRLVIKESLRLHIPVPLLIPRECRETCKVLGYEIPEKARLIINAWAIARDPESWGDDSEEFRPERFEERPEIDFKGANFEFIPFGAGRRMCPGSSFGLATMELPIAQLLYYFDWELPGDAQPSDIDMGETLGATARRSSDLFLCAIPRFPCPAS